MSSPTPARSYPAPRAAVSLLLALYAFHLLPINYAGVALLLVGLALMVAEAFVPSFGALGIGGVVSFVIGSVILIDTDAPGFGIALPLIVAVAAPSALLIVLIIGMALKARAPPGGERRRGADRGDRRVVEGFRGAGACACTARSGAPAPTAAMPPATTVRVTGREGLTLSLAFRNRGGLIMPIEAMTGPGPHRRGLLRRTSRSCASTSVG